MQLPHAGAGAKLTTSTTSSRGSLPLTRCRNVPVHATLLAVAAGRPARSSPRPPAPAAAVPAPQPLRCAPRRCAPALPGHAPHAQQ